MKAIVLSSGGVDSTTCLALAIDRLGKENVAAVSIFYGQKHDKETANVPARLQPIMKYLIMNWIYRRF